MKQSLCLMLLWLFLFGCSATDKQIDPTGTYELDNKTKKEDGDVYGYFGKIQVLNLTKDQIIISFMVNKGAPSYNSGSFIDTLDYRSNQAFYTIPEYDSSCKITFHFSDIGVTVKEETDDFNFGCGFGHAVVADGFYKKTSSEKPEIQDLLKEE